MIKLDKKDKRILSAIDMDGRANSVQLAKKVQLSREMVEYRLKRLSKENLISQPHTVFDLDILGYRSFRLLLRLFNLSQKEKQELIQYFSKHPNTWWVALVGGKWDIILNFVAIDSAQFNEIFEEIVSKYGQFLQDYEVLIYIDVHDFARKYICDTKQTHEFYHKMRLNTKVQVDKTDYKLMSLISNNAALSYTTIGEELKLTRNAIKARLQYLEKSGLILGYRASIHPSIMETRSYLLLLNINNLKKERERELIEFARIHPNIIFVVKHIGKYRVTFECEVVNENAFHDLLSQVRDRFNDILVDFDFFPIFYDHKINYFPLAIGK